MRGRCGVRSTERVTKETIEPPERIRRQPVDATHRSRAADRAAEDVDARQLQDAFGRRRRDRRFLRWRGDVQQCPAAREPDGAMAVGEQAVVPDAHEAAGHDVEQEAAEKLRGVETHLLDDAARRIVLVPEADLSSATSTMRSLEIAMRCV